MEEYQKNTVKNLEQEESLLVNIDINKFLNFITQLQNKIWIIFLNTKIWRRLKLLYYEYY